MTTERLLVDLAVPACFPHAPGHVQLVQTHLSIVCLAGDLVYKLKKAVTMPFVDFAPLAARRQACRDEVRLNRRLCPDTYLGTAALRRGPDGVARFAALGDDDGPDDVDVAVVMRRLPQERMLDELLRTHTVTATEITALAAHVAAFHARAERSAAITTIGDPAQLATFAAANFTELAALPHDASLDPLLAALALATQAAFARALPTLQTRAARGCIVDGHGDLHARNVCMTVPPTIYDCIEFAPAFRIGDVATEIAFLVMDLRYRTARALAEVFVDAYVAVSGDGELRTLLPLLCSYRAMVRGKVAAMAAAEPELPTADRDAARRSLQRHTLLAAGCAIEARGPRWLVLCGPPASGKSRLGAELAAVPQWPSFATDVVRKELAGLAPTERARPEHYTAAFSQRTYATLHERAAAATRAGAPVVLLDGNFPTPGHRAAVFAAARQAGASPFLVHVDVDAPTAVARAAARTHEPGNVSDADAAVTAARHAQFVPPTPTEGASCLRVDGTQPPASNVLVVLTALLAISE